MHKDSVTFLAKDNKDFADRQLSLAAVQEQVQKIRKGQSYRQLSGPCTLQDGILQIPESEIVRYMTVHNEAQAQGRFMKFVPASGAATRMFKVFFEAQNHLRSKVKGAAPTLHDLVLSEDPEWKGLRTCLLSLPNFAFYEPLLKVLAEWGYRARNPQDLIEIPDLLDAILSPAGLDFANAPKGLIPFHREQAEIRTAFQEHMLEAIDYLKPQTGPICMHFTLAEEHREKVLAHLQAFAQTCQAEFQIESSLQSPQSDTIALDLQGFPMRDGQGQILFRPGGHGSLLENLQACGGDLVFIKNIDNTVPARNRAHQIRYKKLLGGLLLETEEKLSKIGQSLRSGAAADQLIRQIQATIGVKPPESLLQSSAQQQAEWVADRLNRPLRVCGMVRNQGEPGGGPFWVQQADGTQTLQIVEKAEIKLSDPIQLEHLSRSTHFNPVDILCSLRDAEGKQRPLQRFADPDTYFISQKSHQGHPLHALEWPGLWNGSMAHWNTVFVEVPLATFNPVKEVQDLLRPEHQGAL
ncbi:MAG: DUF4301 family protein [Acidobacteria bacterium]|nr:DUF4301 family protein [Acidobacteriota bacterium]MCB9398773.1 DUF4301 family protein [Acidobacteriota bacterium]